MRKHFFTGLALLLPVVITIWVVLFLINLMTNPFQQLVEDILRYYGLLGRPFLFVSATQVLHLISKTLIIATLVLFTVLVGVLAKVVFAHYFIRFGDYIIHKIPIVNRIYKAAQDAVNTIFEEKKESFSQVVLVPFPHDDSYSIGMITNESVSESSDRTHEGLISVFVPATPNPTMGFMLMLKRENLIFLDMKVDDALRAIISCGVIFENTKRIELDKRKKETT